MAPRTGPQGVTNEDVARRAGVTYVYAPATNQPTTIDPAMLNAYLIGGAAPGYGMKYGGFPSATYGEAAITGQAYGIADLARQAAQQAQAQQAQLLAEADRRQQVIESTTASDYRRRQREAGQRLENLLANPVTQVDWPDKPQGFYSADLKAQKEAEYRRQQRLAAESDAYPVAVFLAKRMFQEQNKRLQEQRQQSLEQQLSPIQRQLEADYRAQVAPSLAIAEALGSFTPSQLAQQIAVSRYGYDPMLAAGLFGEGVNTAYANQQEAARQAQLQAMGYNFGLTNDEILASQLSPEAFQQYQLAKATRAYEAATSDTAAQDEQFISQYGAAPSNNTERQIMSDPAFYTVFQQGIQQMQQMQVSSPAQAASAVARAYLQQNPANTVVAVLLEDLLSRYAFVSQPLIPVDVPNISGV